MANYSLTINSQFNPFSVQELMPMYQMQAQAQQQAEDAFTQLSIKANQWEKLANSAKDADAYNRYKSYADSLKDALNDVYENGISAVSRRNLMDLRGRYSSDIIPIEEAYTKRSQLSQALWQAKLQDNTLMAEDPGDIGLGFFIDNPDYKPKAYSGKMLTAQAAQAAQSLKTKLKDYGSGNPIDKYTKTFVTDYGLSPEDVQGYFNGEKNASSKVLKAIHDQVWNSSGMNSWANNNIRSQAEEYINQGMWAAIGQSSVQAMDDFEAREDYKAQKQLELMEAQAALNNTGGDYPGSLDPSPIYTPEEQNERAKEWDKYKDYFNEDAYGNLKMNEKGLSEYKKGSGSTKVQKDNKGYYYEKQNYKVTSSGSVQYYTPEKIYVEDNQVFKGKDGKYYTYSNSFRGWLKLLGAEKYIINGKMQPGNIGNLVTNYLKGATKGDAMRIMEYKFKVAKSDQDDLQQVINAGYQGDDYQIVKLDRKTRKWVPSDKISAKKLAEEKYVPTYIDPSSAGTTVLYQNDKNEVLRIRMPKSASWKNMNQIESAMASSDNAAMTSYNNQRALGINSKEEAYEALKTGRLHGKRITERQRELLKQIYVSEQDYLEDLHNTEFHVSQINTSNETTPVKWESKEWRSK